MILIPGLLGEPITMATFICCMWCWILWSPHHDNQRCRMDNYPLSWTKPENWVWLSQRTGWYHALPHLKQLYSTVLWQQGFELELIMSCAWEILCTRPSLLFHIASDEKLGGRWEWGQQAHISPLDILFVRHTQQVYIHNQREYVWAHSYSQLHSTVNYN